MLSVYNAKDCKIISLTGMMYCNQVYHSKLLNSPIGKAKGPLMAYILCRGYLNLPVVSPHCQFAPKNRFAPSFWSFHPQVSTSSPPSTDQLAPYQCEHSKHPNETFSKCWNISMARIMEVK